MLRIDPNDITDAIALAQSVADAWKPPAKMTLSEWTAAHVMTDSGAPFHPFEFQKEILDSLGDPTVTEVIWLKPSRVGGTAIATAWTLSEIEQGRRLLYVNPRLEDAESFSSEIIGPAIEVCAPLHGLLKPAKEGGKNSTLQKQFRNRAVFKSLHAVGPSARRHNADSVALDEVEAWRTSAEGNLVDLFRKRVNASARPKIFTASTPVEEGSDSFIVQQYERGDARIYEVPCVHCLAMQELCPDRLFIAGRAITQHDETSKKLVQPTDVATYFCAECGGEIDESSKTQVVASGRWRATKVGEPGVRSYRCSSLLSPFPGASWQKICREYLDAIGDPLKLRTVENTLFGRAYTLADLGNDVTVEGLKARRVSIGEGTRVDESILRFAVGIDVQANRLELGCLGQGPNGFTIIDRQVIWGDPSSDDTWQKAEEVANIELESMLGGSFGPTEIVVDSGYLTQTVYAQCAKRGWMAIKGVSGPRPIVMESKYRPPNWKEGAKLWSVGVDSAKEWLYSRLPSTEPGPDAIRIADSVTEEDLAQLLNEHRVGKLVGGRIKYSWQKRDPKGRSEMLDVVLYAAAGLLKAGPCDWDRIKDRLKEVGDSTQADWAEVARMINRLSE